MLTVGAGRAGAPPFRARAAAAAALAVSLATVAVLAVFTVKEPPGRRYRGLLIRQVCASSATPQPRRSELGAPERHCQCRSEGPTQGPVAFHLDKVGAVVDWSEETWWNAKRMLATELLELVDNDADMLARVQQRVLVTFELQLMNTEMGSTFSVFELVQFTRAALRLCIS